MSKEIVMHIFATVALAVSVLMQSGAPLEAEAQYGDYSYDEFKCVAKAVWYEGGSSGQNKEEQKLGAYTMLTRKRKVLADPHLKKDWGGPDMCSVIKHPKQYSYHGFKYSRIAPVKGDLWVRAQCMLPLSGRLTSCHWWDTTKTAVQEVMLGIKDGTYVPPAGLEEADSYIMRGCPDREGPESEKCKDRFRVSDASRCYFKIALVALPDPPIEDYIHSYFRKKTLEEVVTTINDVPLVCKSARRTVDIMYMSHLYWVASKGRLEELIPRPPVDPNFFVSSTKPTKKSVKGKKKWKKDKKKFVKKASKKVKK